MNVTAIRHIAFEDLGLLERLLEELAVIAGFSIAPEHKKFKLTDTMPASNYLSWYRWFVPYSALEIP